MAENSASTTQSIRRPELKMIARYIEDGPEHIHIAGEPGIGKTTTLQQLTTDLCEGYEIDIRKIRPNHSHEDFVREICHALFNHLPDDQKEEGKRLTGVSIGPIGGLSWDNDASEATRAKFKSV